MTPSPSPVQSETMTMKATEMAAAAAAPIVVSQSPQQQSSATITTSSSSSSQQGAPAPTASSEPPPPPATTTTKTSTEKQLQPIPKAVKMTSNSPSSSSTSSLLSHLIRPFRKNKRRSKQRQVPLVATATAVTATTIAASPAAAGDCESTADEVGNRSTISSSSVVRCPVTNASNEGGKDQVVDDDDDDDSTVENDSDSDSAQEVDVSSDGTSSTETTMDSSYQRSDEEEEDYNSTSSTDSSRNNRKTVRFADEAGVPLEHVLTYIPPCIPPTGLRKRGARTAIPKDVQEIVLLLIEPGHKKFECIHVGYRRGVVPDDDISSGASDDNNNNINNVKQEEVRNDNGRSSSVAAAPSPSPAIIDVTLKDLLDRVPAMASDPLFVNAKYTSLHCTSSMTLESFDFKNNNNTDNEGIGTDMTNLEKEPTQDFIEPVMMLKDCLFVKNQIVVAAMGGQLATSTTTGKDLLRNVADIFSANQSLVQKLAKGIHSGRAIQMVQPTQLSPVQFK